MHDTKVDYLEDAIKDLKLRQNSSTLSGVKNALMKVYPDSRCLGVLYTNNTDRMFFGMCVLPVISGDTAIKIVQTDDPIRLSEYYLEIDSKLFDPSLRLTDREITAICLHEVGHLVNDASPVDTLRKEVDLYMARNGETMRISDSIYYKNILAFGFSDAVRKLTSVFFDDEEYKADEYAIKLGYGEDLVSAMQKIKQSAWHLNSDMSNKLIMLTWTLRLYKNVKMRRIAALRAIKRSKALTPSKVEIKQLDDLGESLRRIDDSTLMESVTDVMKSNKKFLEFKIKGLKGFESDYYEYMMIKRNVTDQDEALYLMRQINSRLSIIENFLDTEPNLSESDRSRWSKLFDKYSDLRDELASKITYKDRFVGLQVNYPSIKGLDY